MSFEWNKAIQEMHKLEGSDAAGLSDSNALLYPEFMRGMCNAPRDDDKCGKCGGAGLKPVICCNGSDCGCRGMPVDFAPCDCGTEPPTNEQIRSWV